MNIVYILQVADAWLSKDSARTIAVCSSNEKAIKLAIEDARKSKEPLTAHELDLLQTVKHTPGRYNNYLITTMALNKLHEL